MTTRSARIAALKDLSRAREAWRNREVAPPSEPAPILPTFVPHRERYLFQQARRAFRSNAVLDPEVHRDLQEEVERLQRLEPIPKEVLEYLGQKLERGRPRRLRSEARARGGAHAIWLLWGYYKRRGVAAPLLRAKDTAEIIFTVSQETIRIWWKEHRVPRW